VKNQNFYYFFYPLYPLHPLYPRRKKTTGGADEFEHFDSLRPAFFSTGIKGMNGD